MNKLIEGTPQNFSLRGKLFPGWYLIKTDSNEEFLVERSISINIKKKYRAYQLNKKISDSYIPVKKNNKNLGILFTLIFGGLISRLIPEKVSIGQINFSCDTFMGIKSILITIISIVLFCYFGILYRRYRVFYYLKKESINVENIGWISNLEPLFIRNKNVRFW